jgi:thioredoxin 2
MADASALARCDSCGVVNRIPLDRIAQSPLCGKCGKRIVIPHDPVDVRTPTFEREVLRHPGLVLVEFWTARCSVCVSIAPYLKALARRRAGRLKIALINADKDPLLAERFEIRSSPVFFLYRNGVKINELFGALPGTQIEEWIDASAPSLP